MDKKNIFKKSFDLQIAAKKIGLDWVEIDGIINKLHEETDEVNEAIKLENDDAIKEELGDLFFTFLCLARHLKCDPEEILNLSNIKFKKRYEKVLDLLEKDGKDYAGPKEMAKIWQIIKNQT